jgi:hypothetical protein
MTQRHISAEGKAGPKVIAEHPKIPKRLATTQIMDVLKTGFTSKF